MMSALHARESIHRINEIAYGFGAMSKDDGRGFASELQRLAKGPVESKLYRPARPKSIAEFASMMGGMGGTHMKLEPPGASSSNVDTTGAK